MMLTLLWLMVPLVPLGWRLTLQNFPTSPPSWDAGVHTPIFDGLERLTV